MMFCVGRLNSVLAVALLFLIGSVAAASPQFYKPRAAAVDAPGLQTNAKRMAAGLSPLKPRNLFQPSKVAARAAAPSPSTVTGRVKVSKRASDGSAGTFLGYLAKALDNTGNDAGSLEIDYTGSNSATLHATVSFMWSTLYGTGVTVSVRVTNIDTIYPYLAFAFQGTASPKLATGTYNILVAANASSSAGAVGNSLTKTTGTPSTPANPFSEATIWNYSPSTNLLTAIWNNPGGTTLGATQFFFDTADNTLYQGTVSDTGHPSTVVAVVFTVVT